MLQSVERLRGLGQVESLVQDHAGIMGRSQDSSPHLPGPWPSCSPPPPVSTPPRPPAAEIRLGVVRNLGISFWLFWFPAWA